MAKRHKKWAARARAELMEKLGGRCAQESEECAGMLTFDCREPQGHAHHRMDPSARMCFYKKQHAADNLQILCEKCNSRKGARELEAEKMEVELAEVPW